MHGRLLLAAHHLVVDGVSWRLLREDLETLYIAAAIGRPAALPAKTSSLQEWAGALQEHAQRPQVLRSLDHWRAIAATPPLVLPGLADAVVGDGGTVTARLSRDETRALLQRLPAVFESQINDVLLTALCRALQRWTGAATLRIDLEGHGREHVSDAIDVSRTVGWFTSLYPVALRVDPAADAPATVASIREQLRLVPDRGFSHGLLRYVADEPAVREALAAAPASPVLFNYLGQFDAVVADSAIFSFARESTGAWRSARARRAYPLEVVAMVRDGELEIGWHHAADRSGKEAIERVARDTMAVLRELIAAAETTPRQRTRSAVESAFAGLDVAALAPAARALSGARGRLSADTPMQRLFLAMEASQAGLGLEQWHFRLDGRLDAALLRRAIEAVVERHAILRTAVVSEGVSEPLQVVSFEAALPWSEEDWRTLTAAEQSERLEQLLSEGRERRVRAREGAVDARRAASHRRRVAPPDLDDAPPVHRRLVVAGRLRRRLAQLRRAREWTRAFPPAGTAIPALCRLAGALGSGLGGLLEGAARRLRRADPLARRHADGRTARR
jgi:non-ribosomal peptide synthase protein (TIGR01720 family)